MEVAQRLLHLRVVESAVLVDQELITSFGNTEREGLVSEPQVLRRDVTIQKDIDTFTDGGGQSDYTVECGLSVKDANKVGEIVKHRQIVFNNNDIVIRPEELADGAGSRQTLLDIEVRRRLVKHVPTETLEFNQEWKLGFVHIGLLYTNQANGKSLELSSGKEGNVTILNLSQFYNRQRLRLRTAVIAYPEHPSHDPCCPFERGP